MYSTRVWKFVPVVVIFAVAFLFFGLLLTTVSDRDVLAQESIIRHVDQSADADSGDCIAVPCKTIAYALSQADPGDRVQVSAGVYPESLTLDKPVSLLGAGAESTTIRAIADHRVMTITGETISNSVVISGFTFINGWPKDDHGGGLYVLNSAPTIRDNYIIGNAVAITYDGGGLYLQNSHGVRLIDNLIRANGHVPETRGGVSSRGGGLYFSNSQNVYLEGNSIEENNLIAFPHNGGGGNGGGAYFDNSSGATLIRNNIRFNRATFNAGLYFHESPSAMLTDNTIEGNTANHLGGGMKHNGGIYFYRSGETVLTGNLITENYAANNCGGLCISASNNISLIKNTIQNNSAGSIGFIGSAAGVSIVGSQGVELFDNIIVGNSMSRNEDRTPTQFAGGGLHIVQSEAKLVNNIIADNSALKGSGLYIGRATVHMLHTTIAGNRDASGISIPEKFGDPSTVLMTNTIIVDHSLGISVSMTSTAMINGVIWYSNTTNYDGEGVITLTNQHSGNPAFIDAAAGDYHLSQTSAAIDKGVEAGIAQDLDDEARPCGLAPDLGADEFCPSPTPTPTSTMTPTPTATPTSPPTSTPTSTSEPPPCADVVPLTPNIPIQAGLSSAIDVDFYHFDVDAPGTTVMVTISHPEHDYDVALYNECSETVTSIGPALHVGEGIVVFKIGDNTGTHYLSVSSQAGTFSATPYTLLVNLNPDTLEPNDLCTTAAELLPNTPTTSYLSSAGDVDFYKVTVDKPYSTLTVAASHPTLDFDVNFYDTCIGAGGPALHVGEDIVTYNTGPVTGTFYIQIDNLAGGYSTDPYTAEVSLNSPQDGDYGTLILWNRERLTNRYSATEVQTLESQLNAFSLHPSVAGRLLNVHEDSAVRNAYAHWDENSRLPSRANAVADAIKMLIEDHLQEYPATRYLVIVGSDEIIPFYRIPIRPYNSKQLFSWRSESTYLNFNSIPIQNAHPTITSLRSNLSLSDDFYGSQAGIPFEDHALYIPNRAVGRLVETPEEMTTVIHAFLDNDGKLRPQKALAVGSDFIIDASDAACEEFRSAGYEETLCRLDNTWDGAWLRSTWLDMLPDIATVNCHATHESLISPAGGALATSDIINGPNAGGKLLYTLGCQSALNLPPGVPDELDLAQAFARKGANYIGQIGWSYGTNDEKRLGLAELLIDWFTKRLLSGQGATIGDALIDAKRTYHLSESEHSFDHFDEKVLSGMALYGLPMLYVIKPPQDAAAASIEESNFNTTSVQKTRVERQQLGQTRQGGPERELRTIWFSECLELLSDLNGRGDYYTYCGDTYFEPGLPIQPRYRASTFATSRPVHGIALVGGVYSDEFGFDPVVALSVNTNEKFTEATRAEPPIAVEGWGPEIFFDEQHLTGILGEGVDQGLVIYPGQFNRATGTQRLYEQVSLMLYRSDSEDWTPPTITNVHVSPTTSPSEGIQDVQISVEISETAVYTALVTYTTGDGMWHSKTLVNNADDMWQTTIAWDKNLYFFVQAVDMAGNVAIDSNYIRSVYLPVVFNLN